MSKTVFFASIAWELNLRRISYFRRELESFVDAVWPVAEDDPDPARWADAFIKSAVRVAS